MKKLFILIPFIVCIFSISSFAQGKGYYYQLKIYHLETASQEERLDTYLEQAFIPAARRAGIKHVGVFKLIESDPTKKLVYVFLPSPKSDVLLHLNETLKKDKDYIRKGAEYINAPHNNAPYKRIESILLKAFKAMPSPAIPKLNSPKGERIYELRSYEAATESLSTNKIDMFNDAEMQMFTDLNFNAVFYGEVISGSTMPNLMYLTTFENQQDRDEHWVAFRAVYAKIKDLPQYQNNVSKNVTLFLRPAPYSDY